MTEQGENTKIKRMRYFNTLFLKEEEFNLEQDYHIKMRRLHNRGLHSWGIVYGLDVETSTGLSVNVTPGMALDKNTDMDTNQEVSREIVLTETRNVNLSTLNGNTAYICISYNDEADFFDENKGGSEEIHWWENPIINPEAIKPNETKKSETLILAKVVISGNTVNIYYDEDSAPLRTYAGTYGKLTLPVKKVTKADTEPSEPPSIEGKKIGNENGIYVNSDVTKFKGKCVIEGDLSVRTILNELEIRDNIIRVNKYPAPQSIPNDINGGLEVDRGGTAPNAQIIWDEGEDKWKVGLEGSLGEIVYRDSNGNIRNNDKNLWLRGSTDENHGIGWFGLGKLFAHTNLDGPVVFGFSGGALGTKKNGDRIALNWDSYGKVGIGINDRLSKFTIKGSSALQVSGTVSTTNANNIVTGILTKFTSEIGVGDTIIIAGETNAVTSISSDTSLTAARNFTATRSGALMNASSSLLRIDDPTGNVKLSISDQGNVGIGTSVPNEKFLVTGGRIGQLESGPFGDIWGKWSAIGVTNIGIFPSSDQYGLKINWDSDSVVFGLKNFGPNKKDAIIAWGDDIENNLRFLRPNDTDAMIITGDGKVGIGTTSTTLTEQLEVNGTVKASFFKGDGSFLTNLHTESKWLDSVTTGKIYFMGSVGIGTNNPQAKLQVSGGAIMPEAGNSESAGILFPKDPGGGTGDAAWIRYYARDEYFFWDEIAGVESDKFLNSIKKENNISTIGTPRITRDDTTIKIPIGTKKFSLKLNKERNTATIATLFEDNIKKKEYEVIHEAGKVKFKNLTENTTFEMGTSDNAEDHIALMPSGNVGIGTINPSEKLEVKGNIKIGGSRTYLEGYEGDGSNTYTHWIMSGVYPGTAAPSGPGLPGTIVEKAIGFRAKFGAMSGIISKSFVSGPGFTKNFLIDHPLDPENKYLSHSTLEGPEVAVFYRGEAQLSDGETEVLLPNYFEALTRKENRTVFLTPKFEEDNAISMLAASDVKDGKFTVRKIDRKNPSQKFYWEVIAVRSDVGILEVEEQKMPK